MDPGWYENFFHGAALDLWRHVTPPELTSAEVNFLEDSLEAPEGGRLLDVPCGNGRHAVGLARRGFCLTGVDLTPEFIREARAQSVDLNAEWHEGDMRRLTWESAYDGAYCFGNSFGYLEHEGTREFLAGVSRALRPAARFVLDTAMAAESVLPTLADTDWIRVGDMLCLIRHRYRAAASRLDTEYTFVRDGETETRSASNCVYTVAEIERLLEGAGLETVERYGGLDHAPYELGDERLLLIASKA